MVPRFIGSATHSIAAAAAAVPPRPNARRPAHVANGLLVEITARPAIAGGLPALRRNRGHVPSACSNGSLTWGRIAARNAFLFARSRQLTPRPESSHRGESCQARRSAITARTGGWPARTPTGTGPWRSAGGTGARSGTDVRDEVGLDQDPTPQFASCDNGARWEGPRDEFAVDGIEGWEVIHRGKEYAKLDHVCERTA